MINSSFSVCRQPFLYLALSLVAGVLTDVFATPPRWIGGTLALAVFAVAIALVCLRHAGYASLAILVTFFGAGILLSNIERSNTANTPLKLLMDSGSIEPDSQIELVGVLARPPEPAPGAYYLDLDAESILLNAEAVYAAGRVRLMTPLADEEEQREFDRLALSYGTRIRVPIKLEPARGYSNPGSPDFDELLERRGYQLGGSVKSPLLIERLGDAPVNPILAVLYSIRLRVIRAIDANMRPPVAGTLKAMLVDSRYFLDHETAERLRQAGTFHIISISGMHIGVIAVALLGGISRARRRSRLRVSLVMLILWAYTVMVGLAPPVTRATTMISVALIGPMLFRRAASINTVAMAAFVMVALKPSLVADPGFQLSFVAVAAIVTLALPIADKLRGIGEWRPSSRTPYPPSCSRPIRLLAEALFWDERGFREEMRRAPVNFRLRKVRAARMLGLLRVQGLARSCVLLVVTSTAIQLSTLPLTVFYFNRVAPIGVLLNLVAGLLTAVLMGAGTLGITVGALSEWLRSLLGSLAAGAHFALTNAIVPFLDLPFASFRVPHYQGRQAVVYALYFIPLAMLAVVVDMWKPLDRRSVRRAQDTKGANNVANVATRGRRACRWCCAVSIILAVATVVHPRAPAASGSLTIHFLDVGQGDSAFIVFPRGSTMLVDGGGEIELNSNRGRPNFQGGSASAENAADPSAAENREPYRRDKAFAVGESVVSRFIWSTHRTRVDYLLATHAHIDHIGGLFQVADNFSIGEAIFGHLPSGNVELDSLVDKLAHHRIPMAEVSAGESFELEGVTIETLWPRPASQLQATSGNNDSVVLRLVFGSVAVLLAGDIERAAEEDLVRSGSDVRADVLKVPHHGSKTSSTAAFIDAVRPSFAVLSVGERSRFGHPSAEVVNRYLAHGANVYQTGRNGTITVETDGATVTVKTYRQ